MNKRVCLKQSLFIAQLNLEKRSTCNIRTNNTVEIIISFGNVRSLQNNLSTV